MTTETLTAGTTACFDQGTFKALALTALSQFRRVPRTIHYYDVGILKRRMSLLTRAEVEAELDYWRGVLGRLHWPRAENYNGLEAFHAIDALRAPLTLVDQLGNDAQEKTLLNAEAVCTAMSHD